MNAEPSNATDEAPEEELSSADIEAEGDHAADYIEELLDIADLDGDIDIEVRNNRTYLSVLAPEDDEDIQGLVGEDGKTLEALQELTRLAVLSATGQRSRLILDIADHRVKRAEALRELAREAIATVEAEGTAQHLKPMSPYERKIVHDVVAEAGLHSESEGEGPRRHVVITAGE
ncbi:single-stranded DNA-binding protein [Enteractinococcus fodinae]|uniref:SpoIIIJ-associated protein n=1 Tax=Enteractinococcus fodinae TaxID=684663 RepID=A0ABU2B058_9MICC|nr:R3H domain-containing nucleic acid-binding protein [Enteractinococcus fodinae]MDR7345759.1 spoIIIJ-associated protein [Enteractinococcus fodinae]